MLRCIDIGSTPHVLRPARAGLPRLMRQRASLRIAKGLRRDDTIAPKRSQRSSRCGDPGAPRSRARTETIRAVAPPIREASNQLEFTARSPSTPASRSSAQHEEEALAFRWSHKRPGPSPDCDIAVIDVAVSSEIAIGRSRRRRASSSFRSAGFLADAYSTATRHDRAARAVPLHVGGVSRIRIADTELAVAWRSRPRCPARRACSTMNARAGAADSRDDASDESRERSKWSRASAAARPACSAEEISDGSASAARRSWRPSRRCDPGDADRRRMDAMSSQRSSPTSRLRPRHLSALRGGLSCGPGTCSISRDRGRACDARGERRLRAALEVFGSVLAGKHRGALAEVKTLAQRWVNDATATCSSSC